MKVTVSPQQARQAQQDGGVIIVQGCKRSGKTVMFAGDTRPMAEFLIAVVDGGEPLETEIAPWMVLGR